MVSLLFAVIKLAVLALVRGISALARKNKAERRALEAEREEKLRSAWEWRADAPPEEWEEEEEADDPPTWEAPSAPPALLEPLETEEAEEDEAYTLLPGGSLEKAIRIEERRLLALYRRKEKLEFVNSATPEAWERYQKTKAWRGLLWEIEDAEERLARLEKAAR